MTVNILPLNLVHTLYLQQLLRCIVGLSRYGLDSSHRGEILPFNKLNSTHKPSAPVTEHSDTYISYLRTSRAFWTFQSIQMLYWQPFLASEKNHNAAFMVGLQTIIYGGWVSRPVGSIFWVVQPLAEAVWVAAICPWQALKIFSPSFFSCLDWLS